MTEDLQPDTPATDDTPAEPRDWFALGILALVLGLLLLCIAMTLIAYFSSQ